VVTKYEEQSAVPGHVGKLEALIAESCQYRTSINVTHWDLPRRQLSALHTFVGVGLRLAAAAQNRPQTIVIVEKRMIHRF